VSQGGPEDSDARGQFRLNGKQTFYYGNRRKLWEVSYAQGRKTGVETLWNEDGSKRWERRYGPEGEWTWTIFGDSGKVSAESRWQGKELRDANTEGALAK
jgi:antitoxin component YwqK of YwqJK toxin-antitoxin module